MSTHFPLLVGASLAVALLATAGCNPPGSPRRRCQRFIRRREVLRPAGREGRVLPVLLRRPFRPGLRCRPPVDAPHLDDSRLRAVSRHRLRIRRGVEADDGPLHVGRRPPSRPVAKRRQVRRPLALRQRQRQQPDRADRSPRLQDAGRSSARFPTRAAITARRSSPRTANTSSSPHGSRCRCRRDATRIRPPTRPSSTAW